MSGTTSILPDNRTLLETALERTLSDSLLALDCPYPQLWGPATVPDYLLPYLAHAKGVVDWGGEADEAAQRHTVAHVWPVQRMAGTKQGVEDAVTGLGLTSHYVPGYTWGGAPYSFRVDITGGLRGVPVTRVMQRIDTAKSERDGYSIRVVYEPEQRLYLGGAVHQSPRVAVNYRPPEQRVPQAQIRLGGVVHQSPRVAVNYQPPEQQLASAQIRLGGVVHQAPQVAVNYQPPEQQLSQTSQYQGRVLHMTRNIIIHR